jgi:hypothetical protein
MGTYRPPDGTPARGYPRNSGPMPAYRADSGPMPAYRADSGPMPAYRPSGVRPASGYSRSGGRIMAWLPFGNTLMLVPKGVPPGGEELRGHRVVSGGWPRPAVFGAMDGLVTNAALIAGVGAGRGAPGMIVLTGIAGLIAGGFSMATGEFISVTSQNELTE